MLQRILREDLFLEIRLSRVLQEGGLRSANICVLKRPHGVSLVKEAESVGTKVRKVHRSLQVEGLCIKLRNWGCFQERWRPV